MTVRTKHNDDQQWVWESTAGGTFTVAEDSRNDLKRGTEIILHMREDATDFVDEKKIKDLIKKHSEFIGFPISLYVTKEEEKEVEVSDDEEEEEEDKEKDKADDADADKDKEEEDPDVKSVPEDFGKKKTKKVKETKHEWEKLNTQKPIWMRKPDEVED